MSQPYQSKYAWREQKTCDVAEWRHDYDKEKAEKFIEELNQMDDEEFIRTYRNLTCSTDDFLCLDCGEIVYDGKKCDCEKYKMRKCVGCGDEFLDSDELDEEDYCDCDDEEDEEKKDEEK